MRPSSSVLLSVGASTHIKDGLSSARSKLMLDSIKFDQQLAVQNERLKKAWHDLNRSCATLPQPSKCSSRRSADVEYELLDKAVLSLEDAVRSCTDVCAGWRDLRERAQSLLRQSGDNSARFAPLSAQKSAISTRPKQGALYPSRTSDQDELSGSVVWRKRARRVRKALIACETLNKRLAASRLSDPPEDWNEPWVRARRAELSEEEIAAIDSFVGLSVEEG